MNAPHGGILRELQVLGDPAFWSEHARRLPSLILTPSELSDVELLANGAFSPLDGFMRCADYESVIGEMRLASGLPWTIPITLALPSDARVGGHDELALWDTQGELRGVLRVEEAFKRDKHAELHSVYGTDDPMHPGVARILAQSDHLVAGSLLFYQGVHENHALSLTPKETRVAFAERSWKTVVAFQTRNPVHRAHEYIQKCALESVDGLLLHPLVGETKSDDIPADIRIECYRTLLEHYYPRDRVILATLPAAMRYAGPREAIFHALVRKNFGCTHFIVGRDHAGVGNFYGTYDAQHLFDTFTDNELGITPLKYDNSFYCRRCVAMATAKSCPHDGSYHIALSGTAVRDMLRAGHLPPPEFSRPEVAEILKARLA